MKNYAATSIFYSAFVEQNAAKNVFFLNLKLNVKVQIISFDISIYVFILFYFSSQKIIRT